LTALGQFRRFDRAPITLALAKKGTTEKLAGVMSDDSGDWTLFDGRVGDGVISFRRKVKGGATQHWTAALDRPKSGKYLLKGTVSDSRFSIGHCTWMATRS
jgi:hypothetical protein